MLRASLLLSFFLLMVFACSRTTTKEPSSGRGAGAAAHAGTSGLGATPSTGSDGSPTGGSTSTSTPDPELDLDTGDASNPLSGWFGLQNAHSGKVLSPVAGGNENGTNVHQWTNAQADDQKWKVVHLRDDQYFIENLETGKVMEVAGGSAEAGANVQQWEFHGGDAQLWRLEQVAGGLYRIINEASGLALAIEGESADDDGNAALAAPVPDGAARDAQLWSLVHLEGSKSGIVRKRILRSPSAEAEITFTLENGTLSYDVRFRNREIIRRSFLGFWLDGARHLKSFELTGQLRSSVDETWEPVWGFDASVRNHYDELRLDLREDIAPHREMSLLFRAYDDGVAFKYIFPTQENLGDFAITSEETYFDFAHDDAAWWIEDHYNSYEKLYHATPLSDCPGANTPITMRGSDGSYVSVHEAELVDYADMTLKQRRGTLFKSELVPWPDGIKVKAQTPHESPWRTIQLSPDAAGLLESHLIQNLNDPVAIADTSFIQPTKYIGIWWGMHVGLFTWEAGPKHGATTDNAKAYIDHAANLGMDGVLVEGWNQGWESEDWGEMRFTTPYADFDIEAVTAYGRQKGVFLIGHHETGANVFDSPFAYDDQVEAALDYYRAHGVPLIKTGYVGEEGLNSPKGMHKHSQPMVRHYQRVVELAAARGIMINAHEPIKGTGLDRTWPNFVAREGVRGMEYDAWGNPINPIDHATVVPLTRGLAGPIDFTPGIFDLSALNDENSTLAKQLALYVVIYSPLQMAADLPENYVGHPAFQLIRDVPVDWDETHALPSEIGDYVAVARRHGNDWYVGAITDESERTLTWPLDFLDVGAAYTVTRYADADDTNFRTNPGAIAIDQFEVTDASVIEQRLKAGGGAALQIRKN